MTELSPEVEPLARLLYETRLREAWGDLSRSKWPEVFRSYMKLNDDNGRDPGVDFAINQAKAVLRRYHLVLREGA